jgi:hypothetical protein
MNNKQTKYVLFYSNRCNHCKTFITQLNKNNIKSDFDFFCIDNNYKNIPPQIKSVPTILFKENNNLMIGKSVFNWLDEQIKPVTNNQASQEGPLAWHGAEMGCSYSDNYSFLDSDTSAEGTGGASIAHNFSFLSDGNPQFNSPEMQQNNSSKQNVKDQLTQNMELMMAQRDKEVQGPVQRF